MKVFVTGGSGQLGQAIARVFAGETLYLGKHQADDITDPAIIKTISRFMPDVIIHAAAMTNVDACELQPDQAFSVNKHGTRHVAEAARQSGAMMIYVSTDYVFDGNADSPYLETDPTAPINVYGQSKLAGENVTAEEAGRWLIVRTSWVFGPMGKNFVTQLLQWTKTEPALRLVKDKRGSPTYTIDLASAIHHLVHKNISNQIVHASGEGVCNWVEYGEEVLRIAGLEKPIVPICFEELNRPAKRPNYSALNNAKLHKSGFMLRPWNIALRECIRDEMFL